MNQTAPPAPPNGIMGFVEASPWLAYGLWFFVLILLAVAGFWLWRRRQKKKPVEPAPLVAKEDTLVKVRAQLSALVPPEPFNQPQQEQFFFELSFLFRQVIEYKTGLRATDMTLAEMRESFSKKLPLPREETEKVLNFLAKADAIKFAGRSTPRQEAFGDKELIDKWVLKLAPELRVG